MKSSAAGAEQRHPSIPAPSLTPPAALSPLLSHPTLLLSSSYLNLLSSVKSLLFKDGSGSGAGIQLEEPVKEAAGPTGPERLWSAAEEDKGQKKEGDLVKEERNIGLPLSYL
ncbi:unnamed protein product [Pleuronectes platessa]|uniref:Uncharacterized protein n=1 Tax=Pleuronectes platessa TaxID=8262 RepID=A0A9N7Y727_PLEPL|nr:unnamed protein product [Pleuronectes platessa]